MVEHNVYFGMAYIIQGTIGGETQSSTKLSDDKIEMAQDVPEVGSEEYQILHNSIEQELDVQQFTFIDPLNEPQGGL